MNKYYVSYNTTDGDYTTVWVNASSASEAENIALHEYWDIKEIVNVRKA